MYCKIHILLCYSSNMLQYIHKKCNYDFNKPYMIAGFFGKITENIIRKNTGYSDGLLLLSYKGKMTMIMLEDGKFNINLPFALNNNSCFSVFHYKCNFEKIRKSYNPIIYFIHQDKKYHLQVKNNNIIKDSCYIKNNNYYEKYNVYYDSYYDIFDKSGYNVSVKHKILRKKLFQYKKMKKRKEAKNYDFSENIKDLNNSFETLKRKLSETMLNLNTKKCEFLYVHHIFNYELKHFVEKLEVINENYENNLFTDVQDVKNDIAEIKKAFNDILCKL